MNSYKTRIKKTSKKNGKIILACDFSPNVAHIEDKVIKIIKDLDQYICGVKLNMHLLLPLDAKSISRITKIAHESNLVVLADIKLNDIGNTNNITTKILWKMGFDGVIVNPIMGLDNLKKIVVESHKKKKGVIALCHMSSPESTTSYELKINKKKLYHYFLKWAVDTNADGIIVGATFPKIITECKGKIGKKLEIYSPGIGVQGGDAKSVISAGTDYIIVGRSIINSKNPLQKIKKLFIQTR